MREDVQEVVRMGVKGHVLMDASGLVLDSVEV